MSGNVLTDPGTMAGVLTTIALAGESMLSVNATLRLPMVSV
jgi:hypothetical protein